MGAAKEWGQRPSTLGLCDPKDDPVMMIAYERARIKMLAYEHYLFELKLKVQAKQRG